MGMGVEELKAVLMPLGEKAVVDAGEMTFPNEKQRLGFIIGRVNVAAARAIDANNRRIEDQLKELGVLPKD